jgi:hypothetical protein
MPNTKPLHGQCAECHKIRKFHAECDDSAHRPPVYAFIVRFCSLTCKEAHDERLHPIEPTTAVREGDIEPKL